MAQKSRVLVCKAIAYFSLKDENQFFFWLKKIPCIKKISGEYDDLHLHLSDKIQDKSLKEIIAIFYRYDKKNMSQLKDLVTTENKKWFADNTDAYWHNAIFGNES